MDGRLDGSVPPFARTMFWARVPDETSRQTRPATASRRSPGLDRVASLALFAWPFILACLVQSSGASGLTGNEAIPATMRGAVLPGNSHVDLCDFQVPKPGPGEVRARAMYLSRCRRAETLPASLHRRS